MKSDNNTMTLVSLSLSLSSLSLPALFINLKSAYVDRRATSTWMLWRVIIKKSDLIND